MLLDRFKRGTTTSPPPPGDGDGVAMVDGGLSAEEREAPWFHASMRRDEAGAFLKEAPGVADGMFLVSESEEAGVALTVLAGGEPLQFGLSTGTDGYWYIDGQKFPGKAAVVEEDPEPTTTDGEKGEGEARGDEEGRESPAQKFRRESSVDADADSPDDGLSAYPYRHVPVASDFLPDGFKALQDMLQFFTKEEASLNCH